MKMSMIAAAALSFPLAFGAVPANAGGDPVPNDVAGIPTTALAAVMSLISRGASGTVTVEDGQQIFVSASGVVVTVTREGVYTITFDTGGEYSVTSSTIAGFISSYVAVGTDGEAVSTY